MNMLFEAVVSRAVVVLWVCEKIIQCIKGVQWLRDVTMLCKEGQFITLITNFYSSLTSLRFPFRPLCPCSCNNTIFGVIKSLLHSCASNVLVTSSVIRRSEWPDMKSWLLFLPWVCLSHGFHCTRTWRSAVLPSSASVALWSSTKMYSFSNNCSSKLGHIKTEDT